MYTFHFVMEQALGHVTHHKNLERWTAEDTEVSPTFLPIPEQADDLWERLPVIRGNWSLKASLRARDRLKVALPSGKTDALFLHTQTVSLFSIPYLRRIPGIVSLDATPLNYDTVGAEYGHIAGKDSWMERRKFKWYQDVFGAATGLVSWCQWAKDSLVNDYGVPAEKVTVIPPGVDLGQWSFEAERASLPETGERPLRLLFVGGDYERKGGKILAEAFRSGLAGTCELDIATKAEGVEADFAGAQGVRVHRGLTANSAPLRELFARADLFVFPTLADCLPIAVMEAMAAELPVITTNVGALSEEVAHGVNGLVIPPRDAGAVVEAVRSLAGDADRRKQMAQAGRKLAEEKFDARKNYGLILAMMKRIAK